MDLPMSSRVCAKRHFLSGQTRAALRGKTQLDVIPVVFSHCSSYVFAFLNFPNFGRAEPFTEAATDAAAPFDCKCTS